MIVLDVALPCCETAFGGFGVPEAMTWSTSVSLNRQIFLCLPKLMGWAGR